MALPQADGVFPAYSRIPGAIRYGTASAGPPARYQHGRFVEIDGDSRIQARVQYGDNGGVYVQYDEAIGTVTYGP